MSQRQVIAKSISISMQGEVRHFQIKIPENAAFITGIETGARAKIAEAMKPAPPKEKKESERIPRGWDPFSEEILVGELKLQSCEEANVFYAKEIKVRNEDSSSISKSGSFQETTWTHGLKRELDEVTVDGDTTILSGIYRDKVGGFFKRDIPYEVNVYVWYEVKSGSDSSSKKEVGNQKSAKIEK